MTKDMNVYLEDIVESIEKIEQYTQNIESSTFTKDSQLQDAVIRRLEIIGEAVKNLPDDFKSLHPEIPWKQISGMRDILIHEYSGVALDRVWKVVTDELTNLKLSVAKIRKSKK